MILTTTARYTIIASIEIANHQSFLMTKGFNFIDNETIKSQNLNASKARLLKLQDIAKENQIPLSCLEQIFSRLKKAGIINAVKGPGGGYFFNKPLEEIDLASVLIASGEKIKSNPCHSIGNCDKDFISSVSQDSRCKTQHLWQILEKNIYNYFASISLADIANNKMLNVLKF